MADQVNENQLGLYHSLLLDKLKENQVRFFPSHFDARSLSPCSRECPYLGAVESVCILVQQRVSVSWCSRECLYLGAVESVRILVQ